jgi:leucyl-tRNA synthetase
VKKVSDDLANMSFNTAVAALMEALNSLTKLGAEKVAREDFAKFVAVLAPFAPHIASEIFAKFGFDAMKLQTENWPEIDEKLLVEDFAKIAVQVNGKVRAVLEIAPNETRENVEKLALENETVAKFTEGKTPAKVIYVPGKILNIVVK